jgi:hypothetical protein
LRSSSRIFKRGVVVLNRAGRAVQTPSVTPELAPSDRAAWFTEPWFIPSAAGVLRTFRPEL